MMSEGVAKQESPVATLAEEKQGLRVGGEEEEEERREEVEEEKGEEEERGERRMKVERHDGPVTLQLLDASLWQAFNREGTEMIITKAGRRMFPFVMVKLEGLSPTLLYSVHLSLLPCDQRQYKFCQRRWVKVSDVTPGPTSTPEQAYTHPASPNRGSFWCQEMISFAKLKITNNKHSQGDIVLQSMRKYMAQITVREDLGDTEYVFQFPETTFVAVTQYQNEAVTRMKIAHNPFANGFKYAHVTGTDDGKKLFSKSDSRQKQISSSTKTGAKTARVKATITRQSLTPVILNPHNPDNLRLVSSALSLSGPSQSLYFSPTLTLEAEADAGRCLSLPQIIQGGFQVPTTAAVSPYVFRSEEGDSPEHELSLENDLSVESFKAGMCSPPEDAHERENILEEETRDEDVMNSVSPTILPTTRTLPTTVTDSEGGAGDASLELTVSESNDVYAPQIGSLTSPKSGLSGVFDACSSGTPTNLSKRGGLFKQPQPLPRKGASSVKKAGQKSCAGEVTEEENSSSASFSSSGAAVDADPDWGRIASQKGQRTKDWAVKHDRGVQVKLHDSHIWHSFAACGSKMIVSAEGRNMFPIISLSLRGLDPGRLYSVWLHVTATDADVTCSSHGHEPTLCGPLHSGASRRPSTASSVKPYMHPSSPMRGLAWMKVKVDFSEVKLTTLTSDAAPVMKDCLPLQYGRRYLSQIVVREEEEVTPNGAGLMGNIYFFPLQEVTFVAKLESDECKSLLLPGTSSENGLPETRKRYRDSGDSCLDTTSEESDAATVSIPPPSKLTRVDVGGGQWMKSPIILPRQSDLAPLLSRPADFSSLLSRQHDLCNRINPLYCFPPFSTLPPAHVGFLPNRMPYPVTSPLQSIASFPFPSQLFQQLRSPMHTAFGMSLPSTVNPFPYCYYPYPLSPQVTVTSSATSEVNKGLDLSLKSAESL